MRLLFVLLALVTSASANVVVYKGSARASLDAASQFSKTPRLYFVVDLTAKIGYMIFYYKLNGTKQSGVGPQFDHTRYNSEAISADKQIGTFTSALDNNIGGGDFGATMLYLRGKETSLVLGTNGLSMGDFPKSLTGILREAQSIGNTHTNFEFNFVLSFDALHTQTANNGFKNGVDTLTDIENELSALGY
jgi:hypothetical protein